MKQLLTLLVIFLILYTPCINARPDIYLDIGPARIEKQIIKPDLSESIRDNQREIKQVAQNAKIAKKAKSAEKKTAVKAIQNSILSDELNPIHDSLNDKKFIDKILRTKEILPAIKDAPKTIVEVKKKDPIVEIEDAPKVEVIIIEEDLAYDLYVPDEPIIEKVKLEILPIIIVEPNIPPAPITKSKSSHNANSEYNIRTVELFPPRKPEFETKKRYPEEYSKIDIIRIVPDYLLAEWVQENTPFTIYEPYEHIHDEFQIYPDGTELHPEFLRIVERGLIAGERAAKSDMGMIEPPSLAEYLNRESSLLYYIAFVRGYTNTIDLFTVENE